MTHSDLESFNKEGVLSNLLSIEEHIVGNNGIKINTWCQRKHFLLGSQHHGFELQQLTSSKDPKLSRQIGLFREKWRKVMDDSPTAAEVRDLRNEWRELIKDPTLSQSKEKCGVCSLDRLKSSSFSSSSTEIDVRSEPEQTNNKALWIIGGIVLVGAILLIANSKK